MAQSLSDPSLVERVYQYLYDNRGDLARPVALVVASADKIDSCDAAQKALGGQLPNAFVISNYVTIDASTGAIDRWQFLALAPNSRCEQQQPSNCPDAFPLCSSLDVCARLFEGSRDGLRGALAHVLAQVPSAADRAGLSAALIETARDPLQQVQYRCRQVYASTRAFAADLLRENVQPKNDTGPADPAKPNKTATCATCDAAVDQVLEARRAQRAKNLQKQRKQQQYMVLGLAILFLILALTASLIAARQSYARNLRRTNERKLDALYNDLVERRAYDKALESLSTDSSAQSVRQQRR